ncbi:uncharacterized protein YukE [Nocardia sp. GAS34]|uniref:WXG100 family type VII secretion target n=1 Tax=unclassified Nocardia TaxID=2637762 RepID=UPI003D2515F7
MNEPIKVEPDGLRRSATNFDDLAEKTKQLLDTLKSSLGSKGDAWGDDKIGSKFADGDKGFKKNRDNTFDSLSKVADVFQQNAKNLRDSATMYEKNEQQGVMIRRRQDRSPSVGTSDTTREVARNDVARPDNPRHDVARDDQVAPEESGYAVQRSAASQQSSIPGTDPVNPGGTGITGSTEGTPMALRHTQGAVVDRQTTPEGSELPRQTPLAARRPESSIPGTDPVQSGGTGITGSTEGTPMALRHTQGAVVDRQTTPEGSELPRQTPLAARRPESSIPGMGPVQSGGTGITGSSTGATMAGRLTEGPILDGQRATPVGSELPRQTPLAPQRTESSMPGTDPANPKGVEFPRSAVRAPMAMSHAEGSILNADTVTPEGYEHPVDATMAGRQTEEPILYGQKVTPVGSEHPVDTTMTGHHTEGPILNAQKVTPQISEHALHPAVKVSRTGASTPTEAHVNPEDDQPPGREVREFDSAPTESQQNTRFPRMQAPARDLQYMSEPNRPAGKEPNR